MINNFCLVKDDGSGIYTYQQVATPVYYGREVEDNLVLNGYGDGTGTSDGLSQANGIYMDGYTQNVNIARNTVYNCHQSGLFLGWYTSNIIVDSNLFYANKYQLYCERRVATPANYLIRGNKFVSRDVEQNMVYFVGTVNGTHPSIMGTWSGNYYIHPFGDDAVVVADYTYGAKRYIKGLTFNMWKTYDATAKRNITMSVYPAYTINTIGANLFTNGAFTSNVSGASLSYAGTAAFSWDNTNKINGGSLRLYYTTLAATSNSTNVKFLITSVDNSKDYVLRISTLAKGGEHMANVHIRESVSPYAYLSPIQYVKIGTAINNAEILFKSPTSGSAYIYVVVDDSTGTCYIDNVGLYEVSVTDVDLDNYIFFDYATSTQKVTTTPYHCVDLDGTTIGKTNISIPPYTSVLYVRSSIIVHEERMVKRLGKLIRQP